MTNSEKHSFYEKKLNKAKRIRGKLGQFSYINCISISKEKMREVVMNLYDKKNYYAREIAKETYNDAGRVFLRQTAGMNGKQILTKFKST